MGLNVTLILQTVNERFEKRSNVPSPMCRYVYLSFVNICAGVDVVLPTYIVKKECFESISIFLKILKFENKIWTKFQYSPTSSKPMTQTKKELNFGIQIQFFKWKYCLQQTNIFEITWQKQSSEVFTSAGANWIHRIRCLSKPKDPYPVI